MLPEVERILKAASDPIRARILMMLRNGSLCVCQLVEVLGRSQPTVSKHLSLLKGAGLIEDEERGKWVFYRLARLGNNPARRALVDLLERSLRDDPEVVRDRRRARDAEVEELAACCPPATGPRRCAGG